MVGKLLLAIGLLCITTQVVYSQNDLLDPFGLLSLFNQFLTPTTTTTNNNLVPLNNLLGLYFLDEVFDFDFSKKRRRR
ncbi:hypothetical protein PoB_006437400 [Plakobranchus ocellatus]|uniref:Uncharacterized protein n=1 Tax=Plakobranchus ocellatus TaxID=259542 RepID=A0AAV4D0Z1_9GAST|nr:hypothetical protein PoB_006437400 [Plakobranchus ocellatus]